MEEKYGKLHGTIRSIPFTVAGQLAIGFFCCLGGGLTLANSIKAGTGVGVISIVLLLAGIFFLVYSIRAMIVAKIYLYDDAVVIVEALKKTVIMREDLYAIYWDYAGANTVNSRAANKNVNTAEFLAKGGRSICKVSDGVWKDMMSILGAWQDEYKIPRDV